MSKNVVIYVKQSCPYCIRAKRLLDQKGVKYEEIDVVKNSDLFSKIKSGYNLRTVPQIFITDEDGNYIHHIAGSDKLVDLENAGKLDDMLHSDSNAGITTDMSDSGGCEEYNLLNSNADDLI